MSRRPLVNVAKVSARAWVEVTPWDAVASARKAGRVVLFFFDHRRHQGGRIEVGFQVRSSRTIFSASVALNFLPPVETTNRPLRLMSTAPLSGIIGVNSTLFPVTSALKAAGGDTCRALRMRSGRARRPN